MEIEISCRQAYLLEIAFFQFPSNRKKSIFAQHQPSKWKGHGRKRPEQYKDDS